MAKSAIDANKKNGNNGNGEVDPKVVEEYLKNKQKGEVPHAFSVLFSHEDEAALDKTTRLNPREVVFMAVNATRDDALKNKRPSISTCLRMHLKMLKISEGGKGRDDVKEVNKLSEDEAMAQQGSRLDFPS